MTKEQARRKHRYTCLFCFVVGAALSNFITIMIFIVNGA